MILWVKSTFYEDPLSINIVCEWPLMAISNKLRTIRGTENIETLDIGPFFHTLTRKLLFSLNTCTPCRFFITIPAPHSELLKWTMHSLGILAFYKSDDLKVFSSVF